MKLLAGTLIILSFTLQMRVQAQVTIGAELKPEKGALLDLKQKQNSGEQGSDLANADKGVLLPRVELQASNSLVPLYENATPQEALRSTGMTVYNVSDNLRLGILFWDGEKWISPYGPVDIAKIGTVDCSSINVYGTYIVGKSLVASQHYITMDINVTKPGYYELTMSSPYGSNNDNGFVFKASGYFDEAKIYTDVVLHGAGIPLHETSNSQLMLKLNDVDQEMNCSGVGITVIDPLKSPQYTIDCNSVTVYGTYYKNQNLSPIYNTISFYIDSDNDPNLQAVQYNISATSEDGTIRFSEKTGVLQKGRQRITLEADPTSIPATAGDQVIVITTNSMKNESTECSAVLTVIPLSMSLYFQGGARYNPGTSDNASKKMLSSTTNFGPYFTSTSKSPLLSITYNSGSTDASFAAGLSSNPDVAMITWGYDYGDNPAASTALTNYINQGGVFIITMENDLALPRLLSRLNTILGSNFSSGGYVGSEGDASVFQLADIDHPILNGPFGDIRGKYWGYDGGFNNRLFVGSTDVGKFKVLSGNTNYATSTQVFTNSAPLLVYEDEINGKGRSIVIVPDGGNMSSWYLSEVDDSNCYVSRFNEFGYDLSRYKNTSGCIGGSSDWFQYYPTVTDGTGTPIPTYLFGKSNRYTVYNGILWANIFAWAINRAMTKGINN